MNSVLKKVLLGSVGCLFLMPLLFNEAVADSENLRDQGYSSSMDGYNPTSYSTDGNWRDRGGASSMDGYTAPAYSTDGNWRDRGGASSMDGYNPTSYSTDGNWRDRGGASSMDGYNPTAVEEGKADGYVKAIKEIPLGDYEQLLLLNITYKNDEASMEKTEEISNKIKKDTGFEGDIGLDSSFNPASLYSKNTLSPSEQLADMLSYNQLMLIADKAAEKGNVGGVYNAYVTYNSGLYKENVLQRVRDVFYKSGNADYASLSVEIDGTNSDSEKVIMGRTLGEVLSEFNSAYEKYQQFVIESSDGFGYAISLPTVYGDLDLFPLFSSEYAFFKYEAANANFETIDDMKNSFDAFLLKGGAKNRSDIASRRNIFETQALAGVFSNSITIREVAQKYLHSKSDISALGTEASNGRSNWYALNVLTSGLVQILGWDAVLDASIIEYDGIVRMKDDINKTK